MANDYNSSANIQTQGSANTSLGKELVTDGGLRSSEMLLYRVGTLVVAGLIAWFLCIHLPANIRGHEVSLSVGVGQFSMPNPFAESHNSEVETKATLSLWAGVVLAAVAVIGSFWSLSAFASSNITVCERGIYGASLDKLQFYTNSVQLFYDQISSVDSDWNSIAINSSGTKYRFIVTKPAELQRVIIEQQRKKVS